MHIGIVLQVLLGIRKAWRIKAGLEQENKAEEAAEIAAFRTRGTLAEQQAGKEWTMIRKLKILSM